MAGEKRLAQWAWWWSMWGHACMRPSESHDWLARAPSLLGQSSGRWAQQRQRPWGLGAAQQQQHRASGSGPRAATRIWR